MSSKLGMVDQVGVRAGMDNYSLSLLQEISRHGIEANLYTNFSSKRSDVHVRKVFPVTLSSVFLFKAIQYVTGYLSAFIDCKSRRIRMIIINIYNTHWYEMIILFLCRLFHLKPCIIVHDIASLNKRDLMPVKRLIFDTLAHRLIVHNEYSLKEILRYLRPSRRHKVRIIRHGGFPIQTISAEARRSARNALSLQPGKYLLFFGQIARAKGVDVLLRALPDIRSDVSLIIAGKPWDDSYSDYKGIIEELDIGHRIISIIRYIPNAEREQLLYSADAMVLPYRKTYLSGVMLMALSYGLPVIASDLAPNKELITHMRNGLLFRSEDPADLADKVNCLMEDDGLLSRLGNAGRDTILNEYSWETIARHYVELLKNDEA